MKFAVNRMAILSYEASGNIKKVMREKLPQNINKFPCLSIGRARINKYHLAYLGSDRTDSSILFSSTLSMLNKQLIVEELIEIDPLMGESFCRKNSLFTH